MALEVGPILERVSANALNDPDNDTWPLDDLRAFLSEGQRAAVLLRPEVNPDTRVVDAVAGTRQSIPDDAYVLLDVVRNIGSDGTTPGRVVTPAERSALDQTDPNWHSADNADDETINWIYDIRNRKTFYVYPAQPAAPGKLEIVVARQPRQILTVAEAAMTADAREAAGLPRDDVLGIDDIYEPALIFFLLHRAFAKDTPHASAGMPRSSQYFDWFVTLITGNADQKDIELVLRQEVGEAGAG